ncbi:MAG: hypothetical protein ING02_00280 [Roseomonas sp.]|nr:hypothetical protein [Roseomonas sp.]
MMKEQIEASATAPLIMTERDSLRILAHLENPPAPTARLVRAALVIAEFGLDAPA